MKSVKLRDGFYWTGIQDEELRVFDIIMYTEFGTTYNSYVMKAGDQIVLFETAKAKFFEEYIEKLKEVIDVTKIDSSGAGSCGKRGTSVGLQPADESSGNRMCDRISERNRKPGFCQYCGER